MIFIEDIFLSDVIFIQTDYANDSYRMRFNSQKGWILGFLLNSNGITHSRIIDEWLDNHKVNELYILGVELFKKKDSIEIHGDGATFGEDFKEYIILSSQALKDLLNQWRDLIKKSPPVVVLAIINNEIILEPRYDVDLSV